MTFLHNKKGIALPIVIMVTTLLMILVAGLINLAVQDKQMTGSEVSMTKALYLADAGVEFAISRLKENSTWTGTNGFIQINSDPRQVVQINVSTSVGSWQIASTGQFKDQNGKVLSSKTINAVVRKTDHLSPGDFKDKVPNLSQVDRNLNRNNQFNMTPTKSDDAGKYYYEGDIDISGFYEGNWLLAIDGNVTISNALIPSPGNEGILVIICSGDVVFTAPGNSSKEARAVIYCNNYIGTPGTTLQGKIIADNIILQGNPSGRHSDLAKYIEDQTYFHEADQAFGLGKMLLVDWQELYPVF